MLFVYIILDSLAMANITYDKWLKFITPLIIIIAVLGIGVII
ncbi:hypothetical protein [Romboutsia sp.]|nr:hypothetical protein [Romboutsia sp.]HSQ89202.1 hypothetical protein [Romboutsia sp.]